VRTLFKLITVFTLANTLAVLMFVGWLWRSDRLDRGRLEQVRAIFAPTIAEDLAADEQRQVQAEAERRIGEAEARERGVLLSSGAHVRQISLIEQQELLARRRLAHERRQLIDQMGSKARTIEQQEADLEAQRLAWEKARAAERERSADTQLAKAVRQLESIPPKQAKSMLMELVRSGRFDQAVIYLNEMGTRPGSKILREFKSPEEIALATRLLEELRQLGRPAERTEVPGDGPGPARTD
jgi:hypothetical protein